MLAYEKAALGFYITKHPLTQYEEVVRRFGTGDTSDLVRLPDGHQVVVGGLITKVRAVGIRSGRSAGKKMLVATLEDFAGGSDVLVFPDQLEELQRTLKPEAIVFIEGAVDRRREEPCIRVDRVVPIEQAAREYTRQVVVRLRSATGAEAELDGLLQLCRRYPGRCPLYLEVTAPAGWVATLKAGAVNVDTCNEFLTAARGLAGVAEVACCGARGAFREAGGAPTAG